MSNKTVIVLGALAIGIVAGFALSELIGLIGYLATGEAIGVKYLPVILPIVCAAVALLIAGRRKPGSSNRGDSE